MILVAYLDILSSLSTPSLFARYASTWFRKSLSFLGFDGRLLGFSWFSRGVAVVEALESM